MPGFLQDLVTALRSHRRRLGGGILIVALLFVPWLALRLPPVGTTVANLALRRVPLPAGATLVVDEVRGNWSSRLELRGLRLVRGDSLLASADTVGLDMRAWEIVARRVHIERLAVSGLRVEPAIASRRPSIAATDTSTFDLAAALRGDFYGGPALRVDHLDLRRGSYGPLAVALKARDLRLGDGFSVILETLAMKSTATGRDGGDLRLGLAASLADGRLSVGELALTGPGTAITGSGAVTFVAGDSLADIDVRLVAKPLSLGDVALLAPGFDAAGEVTLDVALRGPDLDRLDGRFVVGVDTARVRGTTVGPARLTGAVSASRGVLDGEIEGQGARARLNGVVAPRAAPPVYDLTFDVARLPDGTAWREFARMGAPTARVRITSAGLPPAGLDVEGEILSRVGEVAWSGAVILEPALAWTVERLTYMHVDLAPWAGPDAASDLSGSLVAAGDVAGRSFGASLRLTTEGCEVEVDTATVNLDGDGAFSLENLRVRGLDLARLTGQEHLHSDVNLALQVSGEGMALPLDSDRLRATGSLTVAPSRVGDHGVDGVVGQLRLEGGTLAVELAALTDAGRCDIAGEVRSLAHQPRYVLNELRFADLDLSAWTRAPWQTRMTGRINAEAATREGLAGLASWSVTARLDSSTVGKVALAGAEFFAAGTPDTADARGTVRVTAGEIVFAAGAALAPGPALRSATVALGGRGEVASCRIDTLLAAARFADGVLTIDTMSVRSEVADLEAAGRVALADSAGVDHTVARALFTLKDPEPLREWLGADILEFGAGRVVASLAGPGNARAFTVNGDLAWLVWNGLRLEEGRLSADGELGADWRPRRGESHLSLIGLRQGAIRAETATVDAALVDDRNLDFAVAAQLDAQHEIRVGGAAGRDSLAGLDIDIDDLEIRARQALWRLAQPVSLRWADERLTVGRLDVRADVSRVLAEGELGRRGVQDFRVEAENLGLDMFTDWLGRHDLGGRVEGRLVVSGTAEAPNANGEVRIETVAAGGPAGEVDARVNWDGREVLVDAGFLSTGGDSLSVTGRVPWAFRFAPYDSAPSALPGPLDARLIARAFPLAALSPLAPPTVISRLDGTLDADLHLFGAAESLRGDGRLAIRGGTVGLPALGIVCKDVEVDAELDEERFVLRRLHAAADRGELDVTGEALLGGEARVAPNLTLVSRHFPFVDTPDLRLALTSEITLGGTLGAPEVRGHLTAGGCTYFLTDKAMKGAQATVPVVLTAEDLRQLEAVFGIVPGDRDSTFLDAWAAADIDVQMKFERDNWVRKRNTPRFAVEVVGQVQAVKAPHGELELFGQVAPLPGRGYVEQFGRTFDVTGGEVLLNGPLLAHTADIQAEYRIRTPGSSKEPEMLVRLGLESRLGEMSLKLTSEPAMTETEIVSYITTGRSPDRSTLANGRNGTGAAALAADIGLSQVTGALQEAVQERIGLDVLQVRYQAQSGATLVAGRYVKPDLYLGFQQPMQFHEVGVSSTQNPYQTVVEIEYEFNRWLVLNLQGEASLLRTFLRAHHAY